MLVSGSCGSMRSPLNAEPANTLQTDRDDLTVAALRLTADTQLDRLTARYDPRLPYVRGPAHIGPTHPNTTLPPCLAASCAIARALLGRRLGQRDRRQPWISHDCLWLHLGFGSAT